MRVGSTLNVLQARAIEWHATSPRTRLGLIAFGVGIAEMLEPAEHLLPLGVTIRLLYASRTYHSMLYRQRLCALLQGVPSDLSNTAPGLTRKRRWW